MLKIAILEKSQNIIKDIIDEIKTSDIDYKLSTFDNIEDFTSHMEKDIFAFDLLYINATIEREGDGLELAANIRKNNNHVMISFIADSEQYYRQAFQVFAAGYIVYPGDIKDVRRCLEYTYRKSFEERRRTWTIKEVGGIYRKLYCRNIMFIESHNHTVTVHMNNGTDVVSYSKLNEIENELPAAYFVRCHQSYIVNYFYVEAINKQDIYISGRVIPISRRYKLSISTSYDKYLIDMGAKKRKES